MMEVVFLPAEIRLYFLKFEGNGKRRCLIDLCQCVAGFLKQAVRHRLPDFMIPAGANADHHMNKSVFRVPVRNPVEIARERPRARSSKGEHTGFKGSVMKPVHKGLNIKSPFEIRGVFDQYMGQVASVM